MKKLRIKAELNNLAQAQSFVSDDLPAEFSSLALKLELVVEELLINVAAHAYEGKDGEIEFLRLVEERDEKLCLKISVRDWGPPFDPFSQAPVPDVAQSLEERKIGGLGVLLVRKLADHYSYQRRDDGNLVELWFAREESGRTGD
jgi:anti-sigma regulatory factor (Ser/Thr protein kinase)